MVRWTKDELGALKNYPHVQIPGRSREAVRLQANHLGFQVRKSRRWTGDELELLKERPKRKVEILGRSRAAIQTKANQLGFYRFASHRAWTPEELELLKQHAYGIVTVPGRSRYAVLNMVRRLGIRREANYTKVLSDNECRLVAWSIAWEGHLSLFRQKKGGYAPLAAITNTNRSLLEQFQTLVGAGHVTKFYTYEKGHRPIGQWKISGAKGVRWLLDQIAGYLPVKKEQALLLLDFCNEKGDPQQIWVKMRALNKRGLTV